MTRAIRPPGDALIAGIAAAQRRVTIADRMPSGPAALGSGQVGQLAWHLISAFSGAWVASNDATMMDPAYARGPDGVIHLRGQTTRVGAIGGGETICTLPAGFRGGLPPWGTGNEGPNEQFAAVMQTGGNYGICAIKVLAGGGISYLGPVTAGTTFVWLSGITFSQGN